MAKDHNAVAFFASSIDGGILIMAGDSAVKSGVDAGGLAAELAKFLSGKGGGKKDLGQGRVPPSSLGDFEHAAVRLKGILKAIS